VEHYRLCIARPTGWNLEAASMGTWLFHFGFTLREMSPELTEIVQFNVSNHRVPLSRNGCVEFALRHQCTHMLWLDADMGIDEYVQWGPAGRPANGTKTFWETSWPFIKAHPGSMVAMPYCGGGPGEPVHVFVKTQKGSLTRLTRAKAQQQRGFASVEAVGFGGVLMDTSILRKLSRPYFFDTFTSDKQDDLRHSSDVEFCLRARAAGISIYVNFDCWAAHWQRRCVQRPGHPEQKDPAIDEPMSADPSVPVLQERI